MKTRLIEIILISVLGLLLALEFLLKSHELSETQVIIGLIIGFSIGFKLSSVHGSALHRQALDIVKQKDEELTSLTQEKTQSERAYEQEIKRKDKLINKLTINLKERDEDTKQLIQRINQIK